MKKNMIIALLAITSLLSLVYGYYQKQRTDLQEQLAWEKAKEVTALQVTVEQCRGEAERQRMMAAAREHMAHEQAARAQKALEAARRRK